MALLQALLAQLMYTFMSYFTLYIRTLIQTSEGAYDGNMGQDENQGKDHL